MQSLERDCNNTVVSKLFDFLHYFFQLLSEAGIPCGYLYSALDSAARKINIGMFRNKKISVLLVTDLAARGIDIPLLDNVINYNFPGKPKLFVHRVGALHVQDAWTVVEDICFSIKIVSHLLPINLI